MKKLNKKGFVKEYDELCKKWDCFVVSEDPYCGVELCELKKHEDTHKLLLKHLKNHERHNNR